MLLESRASAKYRQGYSNTMLLVTLSAVVMIRRRQVPVDAGRSAPPSS
jgi:hypothetical protein